eukprot:scaffold1770_cov375-Prasinococcus_capsulatus_cf.AAC.12
MSTGGGFRASLYHLGTLSVMAEADTLRHVDFISTVSGGSIIGVHFFLRLRKLLQSKPDHDITREDYIQVVKDVSDTFIELITTQDSYWRSYLNPVENLRVTLSMGKHVRIEKILEIIERDLYSQFQSEEDLADDGKCSLEKLRIQPPDEDPEYLPHEANHHRKAKIPVLLINAACLNSGHRFVFASDAIPSPCHCLGEEDARYWAYTSPGGWLGEIIDPEFTSVAQLPPLKYRHLSEEAKKKMSLATAAASSAAVPLIFDPVRVNYLIEGIYVTRPYYRVVLVDGSVSDNTGLETLRDCGCTTIILSDGGVEIQEDPKIDYRLNPIIATTRSIDLLTVQSEQDRLLAVRRANIVPIVHISLAFDRRFRQRDLQRKLFANVLAASKTFVHTDAATGLAARLEVSKTLVLQTLDAGNEKANKGKRRGRGRKGRRGTSSRNDVGASVSMSSNESGLRMEEMESSMYNSMENSIDASTSTGSVQSSSQSSSSSSADIPVAPLPEVNHRVLKLVGTVRTHLDVFSEVECWYVMGVAYVEAGIQLRAEAEKWKSGERGRQFSQCGPVPPWNYKYLKRICVHSGYQWQFLKLVPFLASREWAAIERQDMMACFGLGPSREEIEDEVEEFNRIVEQAKYMRSDDEIDQSCGIKISELEDDPEFKKLVKDLDFQMKAASVVWPRSVSLFPIAGTATVLLVIGGILAVIGVLIWVLVDNFYEDECDPTDDKQLSNTAAVLITIFAILVGVFTIVVPAILVVGLFLPLGALFDKYILTPQIVKRGSGDKFVDFLRSRKKLREGLVYDQSMVSPQPCCKRPTLLEVTGMPLLHR